jgi:hypothetical protein
MSEENKESGMSDIKKAIIGAITTAVTAGGAYFATHLGGGEKEAKEEVKTEQAAPATNAAAPAPVIINVQQNQENKQQFKHVFSPMYNETVGPCATAQTQFFNVILYLCFIVSLCLFIASS